MSCSPSATSQNLWPWPSSKKCHFMPADNSVAPAAGGLSWTPSSVVWELLEWCLLFLFWSLSHIWLPRDPLDCSPRGSSVHGISQARILKWIAIPFFGGSSWPRYQTASPELQADSLPPSHLGITTLVYILLLGNSSFFLALLESKLGLCLSLLP